MHKLSSMTWLKIMNQKSYTLAKYVSCFYKLESLCLNVSVRANIIKFSPYQSERVVYDEYS